MENLLILTTKSIMNLSLTQTSHLSEADVYAPLKKKRAGAHNSLFRSCAVILLLICLPGCLSNRQPPDPLAGWHFCSSADVPIAITEDSQTYIKSLPAKEQDFFGGKTFYKDDAGRIAVKIEIDWYGTFKMHVLIYDTENKRVKVIRYNGGHYMC
jgi:hypothetical protein